MAALYETKIHVINILVKNWLCFLVHTVFHYIDGVYCHGKPGNKLLTWKNHQNLNITNLNHFKSWKSHGICSFSYRY